MNDKAYYSLGIDIGSTTVKIAILNNDNEIMFADYERHYANIQETLAGLLKKAKEKLGDITLSPMITGSGGLTLSKHLGVPFVQEVVAVSTALNDYAPQTDVAIELGGEDAKIIYFDKSIEQRMNGTCAGGTGAFLDQMASLLHTDTAPNETAELTVADMKWLESLAENPKVVAIGEIGLDYYWDEPEREIQKHWFSAQLEVAKKTGLPVNTKSDLKSCFSE